MKSKSNGHMILFSNLKIVKNLCFLSYDSLQKRVLLKLTKSKKIFGFGRHLCANLQGAEIKYREVWTTINQPVIPVPQKLMILILMISILHKVMLHHVYA